MNSGICQDPGSMPRLPSFRQLNETLKDSEFVSPAQRVVQYSSSVRNSATHELSQPVPPPSSSTEANSKERSFIHGQEYMYGTPIYGRHESFPNQYYVTKTEANLPSYSTSPSSIESLDMSKVEQDLGQQHKDEDYKFISELAKFLIDLELKCKEINVLLYYTYGNSSNSFESVAKRMKCGDIDQVLNNLRKVSELLEDIKRDKNENHRLTGSKVTKVLKDGGGHTLKRHSSHHLLPRYEQSKIRKKSLKMESRLSTIDPMQHDGIGMPSNDACLYFEGKNNFESGRIDHDSSLKPEIVCQHCRSKETPEWRRGPEGSRTLCNACGLFYSKLIKKYGLHEADKIMLERKQTGSVNDRRIF